MTQYEEIMKLLTKKSISQKEVARRAGVMPATVSAIIHGRNRSYNIEKVITDLTGYKFPPFKRVPKTIIKKLNADVKEIADKILEERQVENA